MKLLIAALLIVGSANAANVVQIGTETNGNLAVWNSNNAIKDGGPVPVIPTNIVVQYGTVTAGDVAVFNTDNVIQDGGALPVVATNTVTQSGAITPGDIAVFSATNTVQDGGAVPVIPPIPSFNLSGSTGSIGGSLLAVGGCTSGSVSIAGATTAMAVAVAPVTYPGDGMWWEGYVSSAGTVTVKVCAAVLGIPASSTFRVRVIQ
jgi:hypothetical protein